MRDCYILTYEGIEIKRGTYDEMESLKFWLSMEYVFSIEKARKKQLTREEKLLIEREHEAQYVLVEC